MSNDAFEKILAKFDYRFPPDRIAQQPARPRDAARLLVYDRTTRKVRTDTFKNLHKYIPRGAILVCNQTKVFPARLEVTKETGGKASLLYIRNDSHTIWVIADRKLTLGSKLTLTKKLAFTVLRQEEKFYILKPSFSAHTIRGVLKKYGKVPLPPYIKNSRLTERQRKTEYQTIFAKTGLSVAAPTASLHFTKRLFRALQQRGITLAYVTLNVGLGTFAPLAPHNLASGKLHAEWYEISKKTADTVNRARKTGKPVFAVGTTVVRTLESAFLGGVVTAGTGETSLFIREHYRLHAVDGLITNFHVPKSSLLMLVSAFVGRKKLLELYRFAIKKKFRLFSFGDGMIIS